MSRMVRLAAGAAALALLGALGAGPVQAATSAVTRPMAGAVPPWLTYDRPAEYGVSSSEVRVRMRDGVGMRCTKFTPTVAGVASTQRHPVVVTNYFAYRALQHATAGLNTRLTERGYVTLSCSPRGSGGTPGTWRPFEAQEAEDNYDLIEWAAAQPWSNGKVGQTGISYGGITTYKVIEQAPPSLVAAVPIVAYSDVYSELAYPGGATGTALRWWPFVTWLSSTPDQPPADAVGTAPNYVDFATRALAHPNRDFYWENLAVDTAAVNRSEVRILGIGGWHDLFPHGMVRNYLAAKDQSHLLMLPSAHLDVVPGSPDFVWADRAMLAWFDRLLMGRTDAPAPQTKVTSWELPRSAGGWVQLQDLPQPGGTELALAGPEGLAATTTYQHTMNPLDNGCTCLEHGTYGSPDLAINDQRVQDGSRIRFDGAPLGSDVVIAGTPVAHLRAAMSTPDANLVVRLQDVAPDGTSTVITKGWLKASHREGHARPVALTPGKVYTYDIELLPTHWRLRAGHFLRITISTGDLQAIEPSSVPGGILTVYAGKQGSTIEIPFLR